jgi:hypothetical protein
MADPFAVPSDLALYLGVDPNTIDFDRAELILRLSQDKCEAVVTPLPSAALSVVLDVASRMFTNPQNTQQQTAGIVSVNHGPVSGGSWLTRANIADLRRLAGRSGAFTIDTMPVTAGQNLPPWDTGIYYSSGWDSPV